ncbi:Luciferin sulfotransferase [Pseudolycoriella hygida]|uniref:Luciferin sulfotransferase n=1 Tax=Pseudolycoriella hygida TaxID=35572 RepID=A0A9Q0ML88_9DIPT|nr:Luciferin sulfotransferase [Pseudolycoriella hygida]
MPIICEDYNGSAKSAAYFTVDKFMYAYPQPNPLTPLGSEYQFSKQFLPTRFKKYMEQIENFQVRPDDVWSVTFAKAGSTWSQEMIWLLNNNLNFEKAKKRSLQDRFPYLEFDACAELMNSKLLKKAKHMPSPRHLKSHLSAGLLPKQVWTVKPKIIYVARGVKDLAISYYHHYVHMQGYKGTMEDFLEAFLEDKIFLAPYHGHVKDFHFLRNEENVLFITYEEMKTDLMAVIKKTATFLGKCYSDEDLKKLEEHLTFDAMKNNKKVNFSKYLGYIKMYTRVTRAFSKNANGKESWSFMRKGKIGSYKEEMPPEMIERFDNWTTEFNRKNGTFIPL